MNGKSGIGRPTKLNKRIQEEICEVIHLGVYMETAAAFVGISKSTLYDWLRRGARERDRLESGEIKKIRKSEQPYVEFSYAVKKALAASEIGDVRKIHEATKEYWQAAAWRLERKFPDRWGKKDKQTLEHHGKEGGPIETSNIEKIDLSNLSDEELESLERIMEKSSHND